MEKEQKDSCLVLMTSSQGRRNPGITGEAHSCIRNKDVFEVQADGLATVNARKCQEWGLSLDIQLQPKSLLPAASPGPQTYVEGSEWLQQGKEAYGESTVGNCRPGLLSLPGRQTWVKMLGVRDPF